MGGVVYCTAAVGPVATAFGEGRRFESRWVQYPAWSERGSAGLLGAVRLVVVVPGVADVLVGFVVDCSCGEEEVAVQRVADSVWFVVGVGVGRGRASLGLRPKSKER